MTLALTELRDATPFAGDNDPVFCTPRRTPTKRTFVAHFRP
jgi:hypothetical protein